jgi:hypothetical protein
MFIPPEDKCWSFSYECDGSRYSVEIVADTRENAELRLKSLAQATFDGEVSPYVSSSEGKMQPSA